MGDCMDEKGKFSVVSQEVECTIYCVAKNVYRLYNEGKRTETLCETEGPVHEYCEKDPFRPMCKTCYQICDTKCDTIETVKKEKNFKLIIKFQNAKKKEAEVLNGHVDK